MDNAFIERLWRTLKYGHIDLSPVDNGIACREGIGVFLTYYNQERPYSSLADKTSDEAYYQLPINQRVA